MVQVSPPMSRLTFEIVWECEGKITIDHLNDMLGAQAMEEAWYDKPLWVSMHPDELDEIHRRMLGAGDYHFMRMEDGPAVYEWNRLFFCVDRKRTPGTWKFWIEMDVKENPVDEPGMRRGEMESFDGVMKALHKYDPQASTEDRQQRAFELSLAVEHWKMMGEPGWRGIVDWGDR